MTNITLSRDNALALSKELDHTTWDDALTYLKGLLASSGGDAITVNVSSYRGQVLKTAAEFYGVPFTT